MIAVPAVPVGEIHQLPDESRRIRMARQFAQLPGIAR
jgi:hypothetical protein